jgi:CHAT domain-containing protein/tetratricopeptide (TPR) repeat protein
LSSCNPVKAAAFRIRSVLRSLNPTIAGAVWLLAIAPASASEAAQTFRCSQGAAAEHIVPASAQFAVAPLPTHAALLEIEETTHELTVSVESATPLEIDLPPPRLGLWADWVSRPTTIKISGPPRATARVRLTCRPSLAEAALPACLMRARIAAVHPEQDRGWPEPNPRCAAFVTHARGAAKNSADAADAALGYYTEALALWDAVGDQQRAAAAATAMAMMHVRKRDAKPALAAAASARQRAERAGLPFYALRARVEGCIATYFAGQIEAAETCLEPLPSAFTAIDAPNDAANAASSLVALLKTKDPIRAQRIFDAARAQVDASVAPIAAARLNQHGATIAANQGRIDEALKLLQEGLGHATRAGQKLEIGNLAIATGQQFLGLGDIDAALHYADLAAAQFSQINAPNGAALVALLRARTFAGLDQQIESRAAAAEAERIASSIGWTVIAQHAQTMLAQRRISPGLPGTLTDVIAQDVERARELATKGRHPAAREQLASAAQRARGIAAQLGSPIFGVMALETMVPVRRAVIDLIAQAPAADVDPLVGLLWESHERLQQAALWQRPTDAFPASADADWAAALSVEPARANLVEVQQALLARLVSEDGAAPSARTKLPNAPAFEKVAPNSERLWISVGREALVVLRFHRGGVERINLGAPQPVIAAARQFADGVRSPATDLASIKASGKALFKLLFPLGIQHDTRRLEIAADYPLDALPFAALSDARGQWLSDAIQIVQLTSLDALAPRTTIPATPTVHALSATYGGDVGQFLHPLDGAAAEAGLIARAWPTARVQRAPALTSDGLIDALTDPGAWIHVAAHGAVPSQLNGYAGLWAPTENGPQLISWLDLVRQPLRADHLLLNACSLGGVGAARSGAVQSFARMLSVAGVRDVIAVHWEVSDSASLTWIPAYYAAFNRPDADAAEALRAAQRALKQSRRYRHPYWWAGLVHYRRGA